MAEKHLKVSVSTVTWQYYLQQLWSFIENTQTGTHAGDNHNIIQFAVEGGNIAVKSGGSFWNGSADLIAGFGSDNDYIVIEPVNAYPGGGKWQAKFTSTDVSDDETSECSIEVSWLGGYDTSADDFAAGYQVSAEITYVPGYSKMAAGDSWFFSMSNSDTYTNDAGAQTYTYFRIGHWDSSSTDDNNKLAVCYVGGYIPAEPNHDTKPVCLFTRIMRTGDGGERWGDRELTPANAHNQAPGNNAHTTAGGNAAINIGSFAGDDYMIGYPLSRSGFWVNTPLLITDYSNRTCLGAFGEYSQLFGDEGRTTGTVDSDQTYMVVQDCMMRWNPSA